MVMVVVMIVSVIMPVIMIVTIKRQRAHCTRPEECAVFRCRSDNLWRPFTADMPIKANHPIRRAHNNMQLMANHQNSAAGLASNSLDLAIEGRGPRLIQPLRCFVQQQKLGLADERAGQKHPLELSAR